MTRVAEAKSLYDQDILLWVEDTVAKLKAQDFANLDLENLIEEVESLGISQRRELLSRLTTLLEHLLKQLYVNLPDDYNGWERTIREQRKQIRILLKDAPSLKMIWSKIFIQAWELAIADVRDGYLTVSFPDQWTFSTELEPLLSEHFWQIHQDS
ncbi:DUF29 domain-containing protein [Synechocystis sp. FACHB-383]|uniref:DUF29 domain-containing protein n=1 Tax=Synechocystis sp. FACHB-383 TaxID=2692864 RepID=UPI0016847012|nr:DUF29 domain-containing protein [Synechocystis sp. FACHB-383]MBD2654342.1 DUF29 domain-containing protein [Synechocystis sp. FACHB-383]